MFLWKKYNLLLIPRLTFYSVAIWSAQWIPIKAFNSLFSSGALFYQAAWWLNHNGLYNPEVIHNPPPVLGPAVMVTALIPPPPLSLSWIPLVSKSQRHNLCPLHEWCLLLGVGRKTTGGTEIRSHGTGAPRKDLAPMLLWALSKIWFWGEKNELKWSRNTAMDVKCLHHTVAHVWPMLWRTDSGSPTIVPSCSQTFMEWLPHFSLWFCQPSVFPTPLYLDCLYIFIFLL